jgi:uncharacterized SAM-dependent methyltransferase
MTDSLPQRSASAWRRAFVTITVGVCYVGYTLSNKSQEERDAFWQKLGTGLGNGASNFAANPMAVMQQSNMLKYVAVYVLFKVAASIFRSRLERAAGRTEDAQVPVARNTKEAKGGKKKRK